MRIGAIGQHAYIWNQSPIELAKEKNYIGQRVGRMLKANVVHTA